MPHLSSVLKMSEPFKLCTLSIIVLEPVIIRIFFCFTGISHLQLIRDTLRESNFDETKWPDLGLSLGLLQPQIKLISDSYPNNPHQCLLECLTLWLQSGNALPQLLAIALDSISTVVAERISNICESAIDSCSINFIV